MDAPAQQICPNLLTCIDIAAGESPQKAYLPASTIPFASIS